MCGRFVLTTSPRELARIYRFADYPEMPPRYNIAPTQPIAVVRHEQGQPHFRLMRWGFTPAWVKDPREFPLLINARAETIFDKPAFRNAIRRRRCLVPADGFYEWLAERRRHHVHRAARRAGAGLRGIVGNMGWAERRGSGYGRDHHHGGQQNVAVSS